MEDKKQIPIESKMVKKMIYSELMIPQMETLKYTMSIDRIRIRATSGRAQHPFNRRGRMEGFLVSFFFLITIFYVRFFRSCSSQSKRFTTLSQKKKMAPPFHHHSRIALLLLFTVLSSIVIPQCESYGLSHMSAHGHDGKHTHSHKDQAVVQASSPPPPPPQPAGDPDIDRPVSFDEAFGKLLEFYKQNKHSKVPQAVTVTLPDGMIFKLGKWYVFSHHHKDPHITPSLP
jgi:hypothetical protein